jgi:hypothetical protein
LSGRRDLCAIEHYHHVWQIGLHGQIFDFRKRSGHGVGCENYGARKQQKNCTQKCHWNQRMINAKTRRRKGKTFTPCVG